MHNSIVITTSQPFWTFGTIANTNQESDNSLPYKGRRTSLPSKLQKKIPSVYCPGFPRQHLTSGLPQPPESQVVSWFKGSEEDASHLTITRQRLFDLRKYISWLKLLSVFHFSHLETLKSIRQDELLRLLLVLFGRSNKQFFSRSKKSDRKLYQIFGRY